MNSLRRLFAEIHRRDPVLSATGWLHVGLLAVMLCVAPFDSRLILGINPWIKPMKFASSIALYTWTLAWYLGYLSGPRRMMRLIRWGVAVAMTVEIVCISGQALRGTTSHFNMATAFDAVIFSVMGFMILLNTGLVAIVILYFFTRPPELPPAYLWGIRLGIAIFLIGSMEAIVMLHNLGHTVGQLDGGPGLPIVNWSLTGGDLRVAHFFGLHALQIVPLAGYAISRARLPAALTALFAAGYLGIMAVLYSRAMAGYPFLRG